MSFKGTIVNGFTTTSGTDWYKLRNSAGDIYHVKEGQGRQSAKSYAAANRHFKYAIRVDGELPPEIQDAGTIQELERITNVPFSQDFVQAIRGRSADSKAEQRRAEGNRWVGFREALLRQRDDMTEPEMAREYLRFRRELEQAETPDERAIIKHRYNIGGS